MTTEELAAIRERDAGVTDVTPRNAPSSFGDHDRRCLLAEVDRLAADLAAARARVERVRALHCDPWHPNGGQVSCVECGVLWPCLTIRALDGTEQGADQ